MGCLPSFNSFIPSFLFHFLPPPFLPRGRKEVSLFLPAAFCREREREIRNGNEEENVWKKKEEEEEKIASSSVQNVGGKRKREREREREKIGLDKTLALVSLRFARLILSTLFILSPPLSSRCNSLHCNEHVHAVEG